MKSIRLTQWLCAGALIMAGGRTGAQPPGHGYHPPMPDQQFYLQCRLEPVSGGEPMALETPLPLAGLMSASDLNQSVNLPGTAGSILVKRYLPRAALEQDVVADSGPDARPAVEIAIEGPTQSFRRWLIADDPERNRLVSFIGTWRYHALADRATRDALFEQFKDELGRPPTLTISRPDGSAAREFAADPGRSESFSELGCGVRVLKFFSDYAMDEKTHQPVNRSERRDNPAALVELDRQGVKEQRWVFAKFPDFKAGADALPYRVTLDCPPPTESEKPDFLLVTVNRSVHEVWTRLKTETTNRDLTLDDRVEIAGSQYAFRIARFVPAGRLREQYVPADSKGTVSVLLVEVASAGSSAQPLWLEAGKQRAVPTPQGLLLLAFGPRGPQAVPSSPHPKPR